MKIYYNSKIAKLFTFIDGYKTIMLFGAVFTERDINNADEDVDCITSATEKSSMYRNDSFFVFV